MNEGAPKEYTWPEMKLLSEIEGLKDFIKNDPKQFSYRISEKQAEEAKAKLEKLENELSKFYEEREKILENRKK